MKVLSASELRSNLARVIDEVVDTDAVIAVGAYRVPRAVIVSAERFDRIVEVCAAHLAEHEGAVTARDKSEARAIVLGTANSGVADALRQVPAKAHPEADRTEYRRRWLYHARLIKYLPTLDWESVSKNLDRVQEAIHGDKAHAALGRWRKLLQDRDSRALEDVFLSMTEEADLMRTISPFAGVLPETERLAVLRDTKRSSG